MRIYLLSLDKRRTFFYADEYEPSGDCPEGDDSVGEETGWRGRMREHREQLRTVWENSDAKAVRWSRRAWEWMHSWAHPDETMLRRLRSACRIELHHPAGRDPEEVRGLWSRYLAQRWWRHLLWLTVNMIVAPPAVMTLWVLPGPNVIGYWFAYRAIHHALIVRGIRRARWGGLPVELRASPALDLPIERDGEGRAAHPAIDGPAPLLAEHVARTEAEAVAAEPPSGEISSFKQP